MVRKAQCEKQEKKLTRKHFIPKPLRIRNKLFYVGGK